MKQAGILLHISSLDGDFGIGDFGPAAYRFADFLSKSNQSFWQILPIEYIGLGNSPYQCYSSKAINPYFIDPLEFADSGLCSKEFIDGLKAENNTAKTEYDEVFRIKDAIFKNAFDNFNPADDEYTKFKTENAGWIDDYALFIVLLKKTKGLTIKEIGRGLIDRNPQELAEANRKFEHETEREKFLQFVAFRQWFRLKEYVNGLGIKIIGDIPIYLSFDSSEVWTDRELFCIGDSLHLKHVSGVPPDKLSDDGQIWGNPVYDWKYHRKTGYEWWIDRISMALEKFDVIRIDHFRGFAKYYAIKEPFDDAHKGRWIKGPGYRMFKLINSIFDNSRIIAEDLGLITRDVRRLIKKTGYAGMKIAQFGYGNDPGNEHLPANYTRHSYAYSGTHDNNTLVGWYNDLGEKELENLRKHFPGISKDTVCDFIISDIMESDSKAAIIPMQDYLELPGEARMNTPSTLGGNWEWKMTGIPQGLDWKIRKYTSKRSIGNE
jgi:4-alpha-glucanotransferase